MGATRSQFSVRCVREKERESKANEGDGGGDTLRDVGRSDDICIHTPIQEIDAK